MPTSRTRFSQLMESGYTSPVPLLEEGIRQDVLDTWHQQGLPSGRDQYDVFNYDRRIEVFPELGPLPEPDLWPTDQAGLRDFRKRFNPDEPTRFKFDESTRTSLGQGEHTIRILRVHRGFFITTGVYKWDRFEEIMLLVKDNPGLVHEILKLQGMFAAQLADRFLADEQVEAALFSEPIGGTHGPLVSPKMYSDLILPTYQPIFEVLAKHDISTLIWRTYANTRSLIPAALDAGINCLWACECGTEEMDYAQIRKDFGTDLRLIGGIDLDALHGDLDEIRKEIVTKVPPILEQGGFLPLLDGRVRKIIPFPKYRFYRQTLEDLIS